jgi:hypothetical protein
VTSHNSAAAMGNWAQNLSATAHPDTSFWEGNRLNKAIARAKGMKPLGVTLRGDVRQWK